MPVGVYNKKIKTAEERFWNSINKTKECWLWIGARAKNGYGRLYIHPDKQVSAHVFSYILHKGKIDSGLCVCHTCDVKSCVNPDHLWLGTSSDNIADKVKKGRQTMGETQWFSKLKKNQVWEIRKMYLTGQYTHRELGKLFSISENNIGDIVRNKTWKILNK